MKIVVLHSISYTGTTWINLVLASNNRCFALANPDHTLEFVRQNPDTMCSIHKEKCSVWPKVGEYMKTHAANLLEAVQAVTGRDVIILSNPRGSEVRQMIRHSGSEIFEFHIVRDPRALAASYQRKNLGLSMIDVLEKWLYIVVRRRPAPLTKIISAPNKYEDVVKEPEKLLAAVGGVLNISYDQSSLRYWEHEHHLARGNALTKLTVAVAQGLGAFDDDEKHHHYKQYMDRALAGEVEVMVDDRWKNELNEYDLFLIDFYCGEIAETYGYAGAVFSDDERQEFEERLRQELGVQYPILLQAPETKRLFQGKNIISKNDPLFFLLAWKNRIREGLKALLRA